LISWFSNSGIHVSEKQVVFNVHLSKIGEGTIKGLSLNQVTDKVGNDLNGFSFGVSRMGKSVLDTRTSVYPNPTTGVVRVMGNYEGASVIDVQGREIAVLGHSGDSGLIDLSQYSNGVYMIKLTTAHGIEVHRVVLRK